jgi:hypothetical protein
MKSMWAALAATLFIAIVAAVALNALFGETTAERFTVGDTRP